MKTTISSTNPDYVKSICSQMMRDGFHFVRMYSKKRYRLFGEVIHYAELKKDLPSFTEQLIPQPPFATGGVDYSPIVPIIHKGNVSGGLFGSVFLAGSLPVNPEGIIPLMKNAPVNCSSEPSMETLLEAEKHAVSEEDFERAARLRDRINKRNHESK